MLSDLLSWLRDFFTPGKADLRKWDLNDNPND